METVNNLTEDTLDMLNRLIQANIDSCEGSKEASEDVNNPKLTQLFSQIAENRSENATRLQQFVALNNQKAKDEGTVRGSLHQNWIKVRSAINSGDEEVVLIEARRGEEHIKGLYEDLLKDNPGSALSSVLHEQYAEIKKTYDHIDHLREVYD